MGSAQYLKRSLPKEDGASMLRHRLILPNRRSPGKPELTALPLCIQSWKRTKWTASLIYPELLFQTCSGILAVGCTRQRRATSTSSTTIINSGDGIAWTTSTSFSGATLSSLILLDRARYFRFLRKKSTREMNQNERTGTGINVSNSGELWAGRKGTRFIKLC